jgi:hypothetical protein
MTHRKNSGTQALKAFLKLRKCGRCLLLRQGDIFQRLLEQGEVGHLRQRNFFELGFAAPGSPFDRHNVVVFPLTMDNAG